MALAGVGGCHGVHILNHDAILFIILINRCYCLSINICKCLVSDKTNMNIFYTLEVVGRVSETQLQVRGNEKNSGQKIKLCYLEQHCFVYILVHIKLVIID